MTHNPPMQHADDILRFWFDELTPAQHFAQNDAVDALIRTRFGATWEAARQCELWGWRATPQGRLAEILVLDQFSRNIHRGSAKAFLGDPLAREIAAEAVARGFDRRFPFPDRVFFYLPFEHGETMADQDRFIALIEGCLREFGDSAAAYLEYGHKHRDIIRRFGRFPHRNEALGRETTEEEAEFLKGPNSSF